MKKILVYLLSLTIVFTPSLVFAGGLGGWTLSNPVAEGASTLYQGAKNVLINGKNVVQKGVATVTPTATQVAKVLARGVAGYALSVAVEQLLGAVDWVLDPANNRIKYHKFDGAYQIYDMAPTDTPEQACTNVAVATISADWPSIKSTRVWQENGLFYCAFSLNKKNGGVAEWNKTPIKTIKQETDEKYLPLPVVAKQVIQNAESETDQNKKAAAQEATTAAAADIVAEAEKDSTKARPIVTQLESSAETATDETATGESTKPDTADPTAPPDVTNISLKFPVFCGWAPTVCQAAQVVISFPNTLTDWWETANSKADAWAKSISDAYTSTKDWFQKEPEKNNDGTQVDVEIPTPFDNSVFSKDRFSVSRQCPVPEQHTISLSGISVNFAFDLKPICSVLELARPALIACSYLYACYIVIGAARNG
ncbi:MAG: virulence factor TspB C-terminal domain-related protein [Acinetobacter sp.]